MEKHAALWWAAGCELPCARLRRCGHIELGWRRAVVDACIDHGFGGFQPYGDAGLLRGPVGNRSECPGTGGVELGSTFGQVLEQHPMRRSDSCGVGRGASWCIDATEVRAIVARDGIDRFEDCELGDGREARFVDRALADEHLHGCFVPFKNHVGACRVANSCAGERTERQRIAEC